MTADDAAVDAQQEDVPGLDAFADPRVDASAGSDAFERDAFAGPDAVANDVRLPADDCGSVVWRRAWADASGGYLHATAVTMTSTRVFMSASSNSAIDFGGVGTPSVFARITLDVAGTSIAQTDGSGMGFSNQADVVSEVFPLGVWRIGEDGSRGARVGGLDDAMTGFPPPLLVDTRLGAMDVFAVGLGHNRWFQFGGVPRMPDGADLFVGRFPPVGMTPSQWFLSAPGNQNVRDIALLSDNSVAMVFNTSTTLAFDSVDVPPGIEYLAHVSADFSAATLLGPVPGVLEIDASSADMLVLRRQFSIEGVPASGVTALWHVDTGGPSRMHLDDSETVTVAWVEPTTIDVTSLVVQRRTVATGALVSERRYAVSASCAVDAVNRRTTGPMGGQTLVALSCGGASMFCGAALGAPPATGLVLARIE